MAEQTPNANDGSPNRTATKSAWPTAVGSVAAALGGIGVVGYGIFMPAFIGLCIYLKDMKEVHPSFATSKAQLEVIAEHAFEQGGSTAVAGVLALVLLVAGIRLIKRRAGAARLLIIWAVFKMLYGVPAAYLGGIIAREQMIAMRVAAEDTGNPAAGMFGMFENFAFINVIFALLWSWALPVFILIWFRRRKIRDEVNGWRQEASGFTHGDIERVKSVVVDARRVETPVRGALPPGDRDS